MWAKRKEPASPESSLSRDSAPTKYLTGGMFCLWVCWFKAHCQGYAKAPGYLDLVRWQAEHTVLVNALVNRLEQNGCEVWTEHQNSFSIESRKSGLTVSDSPDLIAKHPDGRTVTHGSKTGKCHCCVSPLFSAGGSRRQYGPRRGVLNGTSGWCSDASASAPIRSDTSGSCAMTSVR